MFLNLLYRLDQLEDEEQSSIKLKFRGAETDSIREQNEFLMMLLRAHCEIKQTRHIHDTEQNRSEFLNQYLGGSTIFTKARKSLTNSFHLLKRKGTKEETNLHGKDLTLPINLRENSPGYNDNSDRESNGGRSRTSTLGSQDSHLVSNQGGNCNQGGNKLSPERNTEKNLKSPMMDM